MKTITELQPLIYGTLASRNHLRRQRRRQFRRYFRKGVLLSQIAAALGIMATAGLAPWDIRFWAIFVPFFTLAEWSLAEVCRWVR